MAFLLTIITVSYNSRKTIQKTFESVRAVKNQDIEYIVIDGGSKDGTLELIQDHSDIIDVFHTGKDRGIYDAMNKGLEKARGRFTMFLNSDDYLETANFGKAIEALKNPLVPWLFGNVRVVEENEVPVGIIRPRKEDQTAAHIMYMPIAHPATFMKTVDLQTINGFKLNFGGAGDYDLVLRYLEKFGQGHYLDLIITNYRLGGVSALPTYKKSIEHWQIWTSHNYPYTLKAYRFTRELISLALHKYLPGILKHLNKHKKNNYISPL